MLYTVLRKVTFDGKIIITDSSNNIHEFGEGDRLVKIKLKNKSIEKKLFRNPALHLGEGYMNEEIYVDYIERIFGTQLKADIGINLKMINDGILFEKFNIKYTFISKETGTRWRFATNKPKDLLVGNPVYDGNPYRKCLSKNTLENEIIKYFSL